ncbi:MAG: PAS domain S-box protein [Desulfuromonadaceae bacterium]|nr:PAS domain S-box protein [Desulfuromonadaceae bacterium]
MDTIPTESAQTLRQRAEDKLKTDGGVTLKALSPGETERLLHELLVHQVELEIQNEELRRTQQDLEASRTRYFELYDLAPIGYLTLSKQGVIQKANFAAAALLGPTRTSLLNKPLTQFVFSEDQDVYYLQRKKALETKAVHIWEMRMVKDDGSPFWAHLQATPAHDGECWIILTDVTERKHAEETIRHYELLANHSRDIVLYLNREDGRILEANAAATAVYGYDHDELLKLTVNDLRIDSTWHIIAAQIAESGPHGVLFETIHRRKDNSTFPVEVSYLGTTINGTRTLIGMIRDITERKQAEVALKRANEELEKRVSERTRELIAALQNVEKESSRRIQAVEALREKEQLLIQQSRQAAMGEMIGNIAHQWRQPLNTLGLIIQTLRAFHGTPDFTKALLDESVTKAMEIIQHMSKTIDDFRNYFKPEKEKADFNVYEAVASTVSLLEGSLQNPKITVEIITKDNPVIHGYQNEFAQVVINIVVNARDAITEKGIADPKVIITIGSEDGSAVVTVSDNAGGVPEEIMDKLFDPYFTTKGPDRGTGVGLFMSKAIIEKNMGGRLSVRNTGSGAEFRIELVKGIQR